jgi:hypothetical protein
MLYNDTFYFFFKNHVFLYILYLQASADKDWWKKAKSIYEFSAKDIDGNDICLEKYK